MMADERCADGSGDGDPTVSQKRLRNRLSQQAFRKRQSAYIKDLERRLEIRGNDDNEQIARLEKDNHALRAQLTTACNKLERIQITLRSLSSSMMSHVSSGSEEAGHLPTPQDAAATEDLDLDPLSTTVTDGSGAVDFPVLSLDSLWTDDISDMSGAVVSRASYSNSGDVIQLETPMDTGASSPHTGRLLNIRSLPGIWTHEYQTGLANFKARSPSQTNSFFADHMQMVKVCLDTTWRRVGELNATKVTLDRIRVSATVMLALFNSIARPVALRWYTATKFQDNIADILLWQMNRSRAAYARMHANYRPSALQLSEDYPSIIDWMPFPTIRDKLILMHASNPHLDQIICDIATAYVVEIDAESLVVGYSGPAYIRVWDLAWGFMSDDSDDQEEASPAGGLALNIEDDALSSSELLPAPSMRALFEPQYARKAFETLGLNDGIPRFKLDPHLFEQYPELYDPDVDIQGRGFAVAPEVQTKLPLPTSPGEETMRIYRNAADWYVNAICKASVTNEE